MGHLQPLGMLVEHRIDNMNERLVTREEAMTSGEQITFQPTLAHVLTQHLHYAAIRRQVLVHRQERLHPLLICNLINRIQSVGRGLIWTEHAKILVLLVLFHHVAQEVAKHTRGFGKLGSGLRHREAVVAELWHREIFQQHATIRMRIRSHPTIALGRKLRQFRKQLPFFCEQLLRTVALHPFFELPQVIGSRRQFRERHLMCAPRILDRLPVHHLRSGPALGSAHHDHRPRWHSTRFGAPVAALNVMDFIDNSVQCRSHDLMHLFRFVTLDEIRLVATSGEELREFVVAHPSHYRGIGDLVSIQVQDRQDCSIAHRI